MLSINLLLSVLLVHCFLSQLEDWYHVYDIFRCNDYDLKHTDRQRLAFLFTYVYSMSKAAETKSDSS